ncbi:MAG: hypothetical protein ACTSYD_02480 [Candidatus Heimdallarchaeaceae archaeon]
MNEKTVKCPICGRPYKVYPFYSGDQSACPSCQREAMQQTGRWAWRVGMCLQEI